MNRREEKEYARLLTESWAKNVVRSSEFEQNLWRDVLLRALENTQNICIAIEMADKALAAYRR